MTNNFINCFKPYILFSIIFIFLIVAEYVKSMKDHPSLVDKLAQTTKAKNDGVCIFYSK